MPDFSLTEKQAEANHVLQQGSTHVLLYGGSRSGKTLLLLRAIAIRALKAPGSRHVAFRFRFSHAKESIALETWPKMAELCFPQLRLPFNKADWFVRFPNGSEFWVGGLDDKERTEKILGREYATVFLNECSQIPWSAREMVKTRLAQKVMVKANGVDPHELRIRFYYDENPPDKGHWTYRLFVQGIDPETKRPLTDAGNYIAYGPINPRDNLENLSAQYLSELEHSSARTRKRFLEGEFRERNPNALFAEEFLDRWRVLDGRLPDMQRVVVAVDPSGAGDNDNADNDAIGIIVAGLGVDGNAYVLEDLTVKAGPATWGRVATQAYERHEADIVVAEINFGGAMVAQTIQTARPRTPFRELRASRGKVVRAEPIGALVEQGKVRIVGFRRELEDELAGFTTNGYTGEGSPNRADAFVWAMHELFPGIIRAEGREEERKRAPRVVTGSWMGS